MATTFPRRSRSMSTDFNGGISSIGATTTVTTHYTTTSGGRASGFFSEARSSVTSLGSISRETMLEISIRRKLSRIKKTIRRQPHIFLGSRDVRQMQEVDNVYNELQDLCQCVVRFLHDPSSVWCRHIRFHTPPNTRRSAARLVLEISVLISGPSNILIFNGVFHIHFGKIQLVTYECYR